jgi:6-phosphogluconate dehydrogenase
MVHNGIEYGDMQLICEAYDLLKRVAGLSVDELHEVFTRWNKGHLDSYLVEITSEIFAYKDPVTKKPLVDEILDAAGQKGTGKWTVINALDLGTPLTLITEAVFGRSLSAEKEQRVAASKILKGPEPKLIGDKKQFIDDVESALFASKIISYAQGFALMNAMAKDSGWTINNGAVALMWRGGCIIRSVFLGKIKEAFDRDPKLANLLVDPYFSAEITKAAPGWRRALSAGVLGGVPIPSMGSALSYFDGYRCERLPANLLQAQRDFFGAHTYERLDSPRGKFFHTNWTGRGGTTASTTYNV